MNSVIEYFSMFHVLENERNVIYEECENYEKKPKKKPPKNKTKRIKNKWKENPLKIISNLNK